METSEFRRSFHEETSQLLRRRLIWFISIWGGLGLISFVFALIMVLSNTSVTNVLSNGFSRASFIVTQGLWILAYGSVLVMVIERRVSDRKVIRLSLGLIMLDGLIAVALRMIDPSLMYGTWVFIISHFVACCVFPWTVKHALIPLFTVVMVSSIGHLTIEGDSMGATLFFAISTIGFATPAVFISGYRHTQRIQRSTNRFLNQRYGMLRQELAYARQIHEALFPPPKTTGQIQFVYRYEPMRQIGGDYLFARYSNTDAEGNETLSVAVVDVTGHGIPAALTVNRLHGEIDLRFAEQPDISPGELLCHLNRYINLTLSKHSIFATAVCFRVNAAKNTLEYASGGHPPSFLRGVDGTIRDLDATTFMLGACKEKDFDPMQAEVEFGPGDSLISYTDGAIEARSPEGGMLNIEGLRRILASSGRLGGDESSLEHGVWSERILREVATHRGGNPPDDDTLAIEIYRPVRVKTSAGDEVDSESVAESKPVVRL
ncbi:MAG: serine/threonine-protein phosphatase [Phycisphaerales bacterium]|nr:serine/threonine-protein phosphatase [Phycisphaerales bacterium]